MSWSIRCLVSAVASLGLAQSAVAADLDFLRGSDIFSPGPAAYYRWSGFYFGGDVGVGRADAEFGKGADNLLIATIQQTIFSKQLVGFTSFVPPLSPDNASSTLFGGFAGYNTQWESAILGVEVGYHAASLDASAASSSVRFAVLGLPNGGALSADLAKSSLIRFNDYATFRARAGWAFGCFLPYATLGLAVGRADIMNFARVHFISFDQNGNPTGELNLPNTEVKHDQLNLGFATGVGVDVMLWSGLFARAEYEFIDFTKFGDHKLSMNTVRGGLGYRF